MGFSRQEYWSGLPCPPPGNSSRESSQPRAQTHFSFVSCKWQVGSLLLVPPGKPSVALSICLRNKPFIICLKLLTYMFVTVFILTCVCVCVCVWYAYQLIFRHFGGRDYVLYFIVCLVRGRTRIQKKKKFDSIPAYIH